MVLLGCWVFSQSPLLRETLRLWCAGLDPFCISLSTLYYHFYSALLVSCYCFHRVTLEFGLLQNSQRNRVQNPLALRFPIKVYTLTTRFSAWDVLGPPRGTQDWLPLPLCPFFSHTPGLGLFGLFCTSLPSLCLFLFIFKVEYALPTLSQRYDDRMVTRKHGLWEKQNPQQFKAFRVLTLLPQKLLILLKKKIQWHLLKMVRRTLFSTIAIGVETTVMGFYSGRERSC